MVGRGKVEPFDGDLDDYQKYLLDESKRLREAAKNSARDAVATVAPETPSATKTNVPSGLTSAVSAPNEPQAAKASAAAATQSGTPGLSTAEQRKLEAQKRQQLATQTRPLKRELEQNELRMASIEAEKNRLEALLTTPVSPADMADAGRRLKALADEVTGLEERWLELTSLLEEATSTAV
jgi:ATP-binding cassette subfamily F protein 3